MPNLPRRAAESQPPSFPRPPPPRPSRRRRKGGGRAERWRGLLLRAWRRVNAVPPPLLTVLILAGLAAGLIGVNLVHWVIRKPTELLRPVSDVFIKSPEETWESYGGLFRRFSTASVSPELLAALAQIESAGNPAAQTYWRWTPDASDLFGIYRPASSSVGLYQMTEAARAEAERFCIRDHRVIAAGTGDPSCEAGGGASRLVPSHAVELTAVYLDRAVTRIVAPRPGRRASAPQMQDVAALVHLCGPAVAKSFAVNGFRLSPGLRCGDHDPAAYLAEVASLVRRFSTLSRRDGPGR